ncbi:hypothetical protein DPMN_107747 [Dreissena polymorpha]|uniref:Uncharacterized protein n=1 Tax=Dreissena polymorpha TaxID=45954 RepID=A0A9D4QLB7_DREPO|nr:hypothetical protein DPMN_107747 [Dreissena polymorpha]
MVRTIIFCSYLLTISAPISKLLPVYMALNGQGSFPHMAKVKLSIVKPHLSGMVQEYQRETSPVWYGTRIPGRNSTCEVWYKNTRIKPHLSSMVQEYQEETPPVRYDTRIPGGNPTCPV